jgi:predicted metal-dependent TIM-barrel fold hydrolase
MRMIEPHLHGELVSTLDVEGMAVAGVEAAVLLGTYIVHVGTQPQVIFDYYNHILTWYAGLLREYDVQPFVGLGIPALGISDKEAETMYSRLKEFLIKPEVVALGEVGIEFGSDSEVNKFKVQLEIAKELNMPVVCHTPIPRAHHKLGIVNKVLSIIREVDFRPERILIDHISEETIETVLKAGCWVGISCAMDKLSAKDAAKIAQTYSSDKVLVNSERGWAHSGYFSVPRVALEMKMLGMKRNQIEQITFDNPVQFYGLKLEF